MMTHLPEDVSTFAKVTHCFSERGMNFNFDMIDLSVYGIDVGIGRKATTINGI